MKKLFLFLMLCIGTVNAETLPNPNIPPVSNLINGQVPPMTPTLAKNQTLVMDQKIGKFTLLSLIHI